jgi:hypothetical protein
MMENARKDVPDRTKLASRTAAGRAFASGIGERETEGKGGVEDEVERDVEICPPVRRLRQSRDRAVQPIGQPVEDKADQRQRKKPQRRRPRGQQPDHQPTTVIWSARTPRRTSASAGG